jgi:hypothetical protein
MYGSDQADLLVSSHTLEGFLTEVESCISETGKAMLLAGEPPFLKLTISITRSDGNDPIKWGLKAHEDWAFKASLFRFARNGDPVHFLFEATNHENVILRGWVVSRTSNSFWASSLSTEQAQSVWDRCLGK